MPANTKSSAILTWGIALALVLQFVGAGIYFVLLADSSAARVIYGATKLLMFALPIIVIRLCAPIAIPHFEPPRFSAIIRGLGVGALGVALIFGVAYTWPELLTTATAAINERATTLGLLSWFIPFAIVFSIFHSLFEEYYWRWFVLSGLRTRCTELQAAIMGSIGFASHHFIILGAFFSPAITLLFGFAVFTAGVVWSLLAKNSQGLWSAWVSHAMIDGAIFAVAWMFLSAP